MSFSPAALCSRIPGLSPKQKKLCIESPDAVVALGSGHVLGSKECQYQFKGKSKFLSRHGNQRFSGTRQSCANSRLTFDSLFSGHRWNCSEVWKKDIFGHVISVGKMNIFNRFFLDEN